MRIKYIELSNFKSYRHCSVALSKFNVLIGANAAGKSNFIQAFKFLRDIVVTGLDNAVSMQGGNNFLSNLSLNGENKPVSMTISFVPDKNFKFRVDSAGKRYLLEVKEMIYHFSLELLKDSSCAVILEDKLIQKYDAYELSKNKRRVYLGESDFTVVKQHEKFKFKYKLNKKIPLSYLDLESAFFISHNEFLSGNRLLKEELLRKTLMLETPLFFMPHIEIIKNDISRLSIYDFDPLKPKQASSIAGKAELEESGENLAIVLKRILSIPESKRELMNFVQYVLPFVEMLDVEKIFDKYLQIVIKEKYPGKREIPAFLLSDGTIFILSIIVALYFENKPISIFEEPERRIHPYLISKMVEMMKDASAHNQVILSTHNPEIVKYAGTENLMLITRDAEGCSTFTKLDDNEDLRAFMDNEIGIDELFVQNLLG